MTSTDRSSPPEIFWQIHNISMGRQVMMGSILDNYVKVIFDVENSLKLN